VNEAMAKEQWRDHEKVAPVTMRKEAWICSRRRAMMASIQEVFNDGAREGCVMVENMYSFEFGMDSACLLRKLTMKQRLNLFSC
jgi:hypothetical protein